MAMLQKFFPNEFSFLESLFAYEDVSTLELLNSLDDAQVEIDGMEADYGEDMPETLKQPEIMLVLFNGVVRKLQETSLTAMVK